VTGGGIPLELHFLVFLEVCREERKVELLSKDKLHDKQGIEGGLLVDNALIHLLVDIIHHIKWHNIRGLSFAIKFMRTGKEIHQGTTNSINFAGLRGNGGPKNAKQNVGALRESKIASNDDLLGGAGVKRCEILLLIVLTINMHPYPTWRVLSSKLIAQESREINEVGVAKVFSGHPSHGDLLTVPKHESSKELLDQGDVVILLNLHERMESKLASDPHGFLKISTMLCEVRKIHDSLRANRILLERGIEFLHNKLLLLPIKTMIPRVVRKLIKVALPHIHIFLSRQSSQSQETIKLGLLSLFSKLFFCHPCLQFLGITSLLSNH
jgi:hypothetical protein